MPFKLGIQPIRRSIKYLEKSGLVFKDRVKIMSLYYSEDEYEQLKSQRNHAQQPWFHRREHFIKGGPHHVGMQDFVFWNLPQVQYKNPEVQIVTFKNLLPSPSIICYLDDGDYCLIRS